LDGPLKSSKMLKMMIENGMEISNFDSIINTIKSISPAQIQNLAQEHLHFDEMLLVSVGDF